MNNLHPIFEQIIGTWQSATSSRQSPQPKRCKQWPVCSCGRPNGRKRQADCLGTAVAKQRSMKRYSFHRCYLIEYHGDNRATFECHEGHQFKTSVFPKAPNGKVPHDDFIRKFSRYWGKGHAGVIMDCPKCRRVARTSAMQTGDSK